MPCRCCRFCQKLFEPSKFRPDQTVCTDPACRSRRRNEYHRKKIACDREYAEVVRDSRRKWREAHPDYQKTYRQAHTAAAERNRVLQKNRDAKRRAQLLVKNNLAVDLKRCPAEVWLISAAETGLVKNNLASGSMLIFQMVTPASASQTLS